MSHRWHFHSENRRAFGYLCKHTTAPTSCFLPPGERSDKQWQWGCLWVSWTGLRGLLKQDAAACASWLGKWHNKLDRWGNFFCTAATRNMHSSCFYHTLSFMYVFRFSKIAVNYEVNLLHSCFSLLYRSFCLTLWNTFVPFGCDIHLYTTRCFLL